MPATGIGEWHDKEGQHGLTCHVPVIAVCSCQLDRLPFSLIRYVIPLAHVPMPCLPVATPRRVQQVRLLILLTVDGDGIS